MPSFNRVNGPNDDEDDNDDLNSDPAARSDPNFNNYPNYPLVPNNAYEFNDTLTEPGHKNPSTTKNDPKNRKKSVRFGDAEIDLND